MYDFFFFNKKILTFTCNNSTSEKDSILKKKKKVRKIPSMIFSIEETAIPIDEFGVELVEMGHTFKMSYPSPYGHVQETLVKLQLSSTTIC